MDFHNYETFLMANICIATNSTEVCDFSTLTPSH